MKKQICTIEKQKKNLLRKLLTGLQFSIENIFDFSFIIKIH